MRKQQESLYLGLAHLFNAVPLWGLLFCGWIWFSFREESRKVVGEAERAMTFHALLMSAGVIWIMVWLLGRLVWAIAPSAGTILIALNHALMLSLTAAYAAVCVRASLHAFAGKAAHYPIIRQSGTKS